MILVIDNYDSFTYNLVQYIGELGYDIRVTRNDEITISQILNLSPSHIIISPGPGDPSSSGVSLEIIRELCYTKPILGVCLGHQSIGALFGATIRHAPFPMHGKTSMVYHDNKGIFTGLANPFKVIRYHSLVIDKSTFPNNLMLNAWTEDNIIMGCQHNLYRNVYGIQFHPESLWTDSGQVLLHNFLNL